ncbi:glycosyltransferase family A protein [uncultured Ornithinimicrobium sp.]|uniref:glycosyltransferase family 2 protein n=1 Tax=uncultured Ornithinimicrobium sp. TaxID=259307 RepID=UPI00259233A7|nr:glycosyltransferase family A protein [uncultured Ornithinimicrobium sp.]
MTRVTAIIPAHNPGVFLKRSLGSVLVQEDVDFDVVVIDDGSSDDLSRVPGVRDSRVRLIQTENRGVSAARNLAVAISDAEYVAFLDQDDEWVATGKLAQQVAAHDADPATAFVHTGFTWVLPETHQDASSPGAVTYEQNLAGRAYVCLSSILVRRDHYITVGGHDVFLVQQQDWDLILKLLMVYGPALAIDRAMVRYHVHGSNASGDYARAEKESDLVYRRHTTGRTTDHIRQGRRQADRLYASKGIDAARQAVRSGDRREVMKHLVAAGRIAPTSLPRAAWATLSRRL